MEELKRCPFCGGEAEFHRNISVIGYIVTVRCKTCQVKTAGILFDARKHSNDEEYDEAAALWNNRKPVEDVLEQLEAVKDNDVKVYGKRYAADSFAAGYAEGTKDAINIIKTELGG